MKKFIPLIGILSAAVVLAVRVYVYFKNGDDFGDDILTAGEKRGGFSIFRK